MINIQTKSFIVVGFGGLIDEEISICFCLILSNNNSIPPLLFFTRQKKKNYPIL